MGGVLFAGGVAGLSEGAVRGCSSDCAQHDGARAHTVVAVLDVDRHRSSALEDGRRL